MKQFQCPRCSTYYGPEQVLEHSSAGTLHCPADRSRLTTIPIDDAVDLSDQVFFTETREPATKYHLQDSAKVVHEDGWKKAAFETALRLILILAACGAGIALSRLLGR